MTTVPDFWFLSRTPVCGGPVDLPVHPVSWRPEVGPPPSYSRVTSSLVVEFPLSILTTSSVLVVPSPSVAARDTPVLSSVYPGGSHCLPALVTAACTPVRHVAHKSSLFVLPATVNTHDCRVLLDSGASENFISSSFVSHWGLPTIPLRQPFTVRAVNGSPLTVNIFVRSLLRFEGVQLHLGLRVVDISPISTKTHPNY